MYAADRTVIGLATALVLVSAPTIAEDYKKALEDRIERLERIKSSARPSDPEPAKLSKKLVAKKMRYDWEVAQCWHPVTPGTFEYRPKRRNSSEKDGYINNNKYSYYQNLKSHGIVKIHLDKSGTGGMGNFHPDAYGGRVTISFVPSQKNNKLVIGKNGNSFCLPNGQIKKLSVKKIEYLKAGQQPKWDATVVYITYQMRWEPWYRKWQKISGNIEPKNSRKGVVVYRRDTFTDRWNEVGGTFANIDDKLNMGHVAQALQKN